MVSRFNNNSVNDKVYLEKERVKKNIDSGEN